MTKITIDRHHRDSRAPNFPERERQAKHLLTEEHPNWAWLLVSEQWRMKFRAYAEAVIEREDAERDALEAALHRPPHRTSIINRGEGAKSE